MSDDLQAAFSRTFGRIANYDRTDVLLTLSVGAEFTEPVRGNSPSIA